MTAARPTVTLTAWSPFAGGHQRYWRHPDGRDTIAARLYNNRGSWQAHLRDPAGRELDGVVWFGVTPKQAKANAEVELDRVRREWAPGEVKA